MNAVATTVDFPQLPAETLDGWVEEGLRHHRDGKFDDARAVYEAVLAAQPDNCMILSLLGLLRHQVGDSAGGAELIRRAVAQAPETAILRDHLGLALDGMGDAEGAMQSHAESVILDPQHGPGWYNLGMLLLRNSRADDALRCLMTSLDVEPRSPIYRAGFGRVLTALGHYPEAADAYRLALLADPEFIEAYTGLASLWMESGDMESAAFSAGAAEKLRDGAGEPATVIARSVSQRIDASFPSQLAH